MASYLALFALSLVVVFWTADRMLLNAVAMSNRLRIPPMIVGAVIVGFGTSAPELAVSSIAAFNGSLEIAVGNALGSNIANIALVIGTVALVSGISASTSDTRLSFLIMLAAMALPGLLLLDQNHLGRDDGVLLLAALAAAMYLVVKTTDFAPENDDMTRLADRQKHTGFWLALWIALMLAASYVTVWSAINIARALGISELIIGLSAIAIGTSLPELAAALIGAYRKQHKIAIGVILGSNLFNSLAVIGLPSLIAPAQLSDEVLTRDYPTTLGVAVLMWVLMIVPPRRSLGRAKGAILLACFVAYQMILYTRLLG